MKSKSLFISLVLTIAPFLLSSANAQTQRNDPSMYLPKEKREAYLAKKQAEEEAAKAKEEKLLAQAPFKLIEAGRNYVLKGSSAASRMAIPVKQWVHLDKWPYKNPPRVTLKQTGREFIVRGFAQITEGEAAGQWQFLIEFAPIKIPEKADFIVSSPEGETPEGIAIYSFAWELR